MTEMHRQTEQMLGIVNRTIGNMGVSNVRSWLTDRLNNCAKLAATKAGSDRNGWLEDAAYFSAAIAMIDWTALEATEGSALNGDIAMNDDDRAFVGLLSKALLKVRPLGGSELFVRRNGQYFADPAYCGAAIEADAKARHEAMADNIRLKRRAAALEMVIREELPPVSCGCDANRMIVESIHGVVGSPSVEK
jgi:hypothetical protein